MSELTVQDGKLVARNGSLGTGQGCCCSGGGACCLNDGTCTTEYQTREQCEECVTSYTCFDFATSEETPVASCDQCVGETKFCSSSTSGPCGTFAPGQTCDPSPCCASNEDCPQFDPECEAIPMACCDNVCKPWSCFPGIWIKMTFTKPVACDPATYPGLAHVNAGAQFDIVISGGTLVCEEFADLSSAPCNTTWRLSRGCILSNFNFDTVNVQTPQLCADCYSDLDSWSYGRNDPTGVTATPPGSWNPCP